MASLAPGLRFGYAGDTVQGPILLYTVPRKEDKKGNNTVRVSYCTLISASLLLAFPTFALAGPKSTPLRMHSHASVKHTSGKRMAASHVAAPHETAHHETASHETEHHEIAYHETEHHETAHHEAAAVEMPDERATQIQAALIRQGYLTGEPTGTWDAQTAAAMEKLQADNGWQTRITPDSRALIKLGLGPDQPNDIAQTQPQ
jgi:hypothetical protein